MDTTSTIATKNSEVLSSHSTASQYFDMFSSDKDALSAWGKTRAGYSEHTMRAYAGAVAAFATWLDSRKGQKPDQLITATNMDAHSYVAEMLSESSKLKPASVKYRITILKALYAYWLKPKEGGRQIVNSNPFDDVGKSIQGDRGSSNLGSQRSLSPQEVSAVEWAIESLKSSEHSKHYHRANLIWLLASKMALRRFEIADLKTNDFHVNRGKRYWTLKIKGKGRALSSELDTVIANEQVIEGIREYRKSLGLHSEPLPSDSSPLIRRVQGENSKAMSSEHVGKLMKQIFRIAADHAIKDLQDPRMAERLNSASIHWGRHTWFMVALRKDHPIQLVSKGGRHKDIRTTQKSYVSLNEDDLAALML